MNVKKVLCIVLLAAVVLAVPISSSAADTQIVTGKVYLIKSDSTNYYVSTRGAKTEGAAVYVDKTKAGNYRVGYDPKQLWYSPYPSTGARSLRSQGARMYLDTRGRLEIDDTCVFYESQASGVADDGVTIGTTLSRYMYYNPTTLQVMFGTGKKPVWYLMPAYSLDYPTTNFGTDYIADDAFKTKFPEGQCTWYVAGRVQEKLGITLDFTQDSGNDAVHWYDRVCNPGIVKSNTPRANSIAVFGSSGSRGHVVFVEYVEDGYVYFSEANCAPSNNGRFDIGEDGILKRQTIAQFETRSVTGPLKGYIWLDLATISY